MRLANSTILVLFFGLLLACGNHNDAREATEPQLSSWAATSSVERIQEFIAEVTEPNSPHFVPPENRIVVFDNDGTLWSEKPFYFQLLFALDRVKELAPNHPEWREEEPFASILEGDIESALHSEESLVKLVVATHSGIDSEAFEGVVGEWMKTAVHPTTGRHLLDMTFAPMKELIELLSYHDFKCFIVSGGGIDFMRPWATQAYGIPRERIIGSQMALSYGYDEQGEPRIMREPSLWFIDDKATKPVGIQRHIGQRPIMAFGNSDGDRAMMEWTMAGEGARLAVYIHHTDGEREWAYDRDSSVGQLDVGLDQALDEDWLIVDMATDWRQIFSPE